MKRILSLILVLLLALTVFVGCDKIKLPDIFGGPKEDPTPTYDIDAAVEYVKQLYIEDAVSTGADYELVGQVMVAGAKYTVTWTVDTDAISVTVDGLKVTIDVPDESAEEISYKLTATVAAPDGTTGTYTFDRLVPKFKVNTYAEYIAAKDGDALVVEGIIYGIMSKEAGDKENSIFVQDLSGNGGYYLYAVSDDVIAAAVIGQTIEARGNKAIYNGTPELKNATIKVLDTTIKTVAPADLTAAYTAAADAKDAALLAHLGGLVTVKGVTVLDAGDNGYYYFELDGVKTYLRISSSSNCSSADDEKTIAKNHAAKFYYSADVTGIAAIYNGAFYIMPIDANAFSNFSDEMQLMPDDVKVSFESGKLTLPTEIVSDNTITLPSVGATVKEVTITWALAEGTTNATLVDGVLAGVLPESGSVDVVITATLTAGDETATKEFTISVKKVDTTTITDANGIATEAGDSYTTDKYIVAGTIVEIASDKYGNLYIADAEGNRFYVYGVYSAYGDLRYDKLAEAPKVGDTVVLYGVLGTYTKDGVATIQMKNAWLLSWEHVYTLGDTVAPTCTEDGYTSATCACGHEAKLDVVPATGHQNTEDREAIESTCQQEGYTAGTYCLDCETYIDGGEYLGKAADHNWVENVCTWCKVPNHTCEYTANPVVTAPKCEEGGYTTYSCSFEGCGKTEVRDETDPTGHVNTTEVVTKQPSCYEATDEEPNAGLGEKQVVCSCGHVVSTTTLDRVAHTPDREAATCTVAKACTVCEKELEAKTSHTYENGACVCGAKDPSYLAEMTVEEALKAPEGQKVKLTGTVTGFYEVWSSYGNCSPYITDASGKTILVFRTTTNVGVGDVISVEGTIGVFNGVNQIAQSGSVVTIVTVHVCSDWADATCTSPKTCKVCGATTGTVTDHVYVDGVCECGAQQGVSYTKATAKYTGGTTTNLTAGTVAKNATDIGLDSGVFSVTVNKCDNSTAVGLNKSGQIRLYSGKVGDAYNGNGSELVITATGRTIASIKITFGTVNGGCQVSAGDTVLGTTTATSSTLEYTINAESFMLKNVCPNDKTQVYILSIEITYA